MIRPIEDFVRICLALRGKPYVWGAAGPDSFDCSGLVMWATRQLGVTFSDHYTGDQWHDSQHVSVAQATRTRGALLFEGQNASQHVVVSLGDGRTIEARGRAYGVGSWEIAGRPFTLAGLIPGFSYDAHPVPAPSMPPWPGVYYRLTTPHMGGDAVKWIQRRLIAHGVSVGSYGADGDFGQDTKGAVVIFQRSAGLDHDGIVGPDTWGALSHA